MRGRVGYLALLAGALVALIGSAAWATTRSQGRILVRHGMAAASSCAPPRLVGSIVGVRLIGMRGGMMGGSMMGGSGGGIMRLVSDRSTVTAGRVSFVAQSIGGAVHELVVLPLSAGQTVGQRTVGGERVSEAGSLGEASRSCGAGTGDGIEPGATGWVTLNLKPGRYELVCNLDGHYRTGMYRELDVE